MPASTILSKCQSKLFFFSFILLISYKDNLNLLYVSLGIRYLIRIGNKYKSNTNAETNVTDINSPTILVGWELDNNRTMNQKNKITVVIIIALPVSV